jgi:hypothetical protein
VKGHRHHHQGEDRQDGEAASIAEATHLAVVTHPLDYLLLDHPLLALHPDYPPLLALHPDYSPLALATVATHLAVVKHLERRWGSGYWSLHLAS